MLPKIITSLSLILLSVFWVQVTLFHNDGRWRKLQMWFPVVWIPPVIILGMLAAAGPRLALPLYLIALLALAGGAFMGALYHLLGVARLPGGFTLANVVAGPPFLLPLALACVCLIALAAGWAQYAG